MTPPDVRPEGSRAVAQEYEEEIAPFTALYAEDAARIVDVKPRERVADVACGTGAFAIAAARRGASAIAMDASPETVERLKKRLSRERVPNVDARVMDGQALALPGAAFDVASSLFGLHFFPESAAGFREMRRVLKPGGRAVIATWSEIARVQFMAPLAAALGEALPDLPAPSGTSPIFSLADPKRIESEMTDAGFRDVRVETVTHSWTFRNAVDAHARLARGSPVLHALTASLAEADRARVRDAFLRAIRAEFGDGPVALPSEARVAVGVK